MDTVTEDFAQSEVDTEMRVLSPEDLAEEHLEATDEVEILQNRCKPFTC